MTCRYCCKCKPDLDVCLGKCLGKIEFLHELTGENCSVSITPKGCPRDENGNVIECAFNVDFPDDSQERCDFEVLTCRYGYQKNPKFIEFMKKHIVFDYEDEYSAVKQDYIIKHYCPHSAEFLKK